MPRAKQWPRLDLPKVGLVRLELSATFPETSKTFELLEPQLGSALDEDAFFSAAAYTRSKITHGIMQSAMLIELDDGSLAIALAIGYDASGEIPDEPVPREMQREAVLLRILGSGRDAGPISCQAQFAYDADRFPAARSVLDALPPPKPGPDFKIDEILGISGTTHIGEGPGAWPAYFFVERIPEQGIRLSLSFGHEEAVLIGEFVEQVFEQVQLAASTLVFPNGR